MKYFYIGVALLFLFSCKSPIEMSAPPPAVRIIPLNSDPQPFPPGTNLYAEVDLNDVQKAKVGIAYQWYRIDTDAGTESIETATENIYTTKDPDDSNDSIFVTATYKNGRSVSNAVQIGTTSVIVTESMEF
jgi:hypothetical protein